MSDTEERDEIIDDDYYLEGDDGEELIDLGDDIQPFSMNLKPDKNSFQGNIFLNNYEKDKIKVKQKYDSYSDDDFE